MSCSASISSSTTSNFPEFRDIFNDWTWPSNDRPHPYRRSMLTLNPRLMDRASLREELVSPKDTRFSDIIPEEADATDDEPGWGQSFLCFDSFTSIDLVSPPETPSPVSDDSAPQTPYQLHSTQSPVNQHFPSSAFSSPTASTCSIASNSTFENAFGEVSNLPPSRSGATSPASQKARRGILPSKFDPPTPVVGAFEPLEISPRRSTSSLVSSAKKVMTRKLGLRKSKESSR